MWGMTSAWVRLGISQLTWFSSFSLLWLSTRSGEQSLEELIKLSPLPGGGFWWPQLFLEHLSGHITSQRRQPMLRSMAYHPGTFHPGATGWIFNTSSNSVHSCQWLALLLRHVSFVIRLRGWRYMTSSVVAYTWLLRIWLGMTIVYTWSLGIWHLTKEF